ncbi:hypothetical protein EGW08_020635, partial [Elysia chlorotica]
MNVASHISVDLDLHRGIIFFVFICLQYLAVLCAPPELEMDPVTPIYGYPYFVMCTLKVDRMDKRSLARPVEFELLEKRKKCVVTDWSYCLIPPASPPLWSCGCSSRTEDGSDAIYRFYFNIQNIDDSYRAEQVKIKMGTIELIKQMTIV